MARRRTRDELQLIRKTNNLKSKGLGQIGMFSFLNRKKQESQRKVA